MLFKGDDFVMNGLNIQTIHVLHEHMIWQQAA